jgi:PBSX family phage terminase large subunit
LFRGLHHNEQSIKSIEGIDIAWIEEAQTVSEQSIEVLTPTIRKPGSQIIYTYNRLKEDDPVHKRLVKEGRPNTLVLNVNYDVAIKYGWMPEVLRIEMEDDKQHRPNLYKHKWLGEPNNAEGRVYNNWLVIPEVPHEARLVRRGLDFGYSVDPAAIIDLYYYNGGYIVSERLYRRGMKNNDLGTFLSNLDNPTTTVMADSAEPKSIAEIVQYNVPIIAVRKKGSRDKSYLSFSIDYVQQQKISITQNSTNLIDEYENYYWATDKDGKPLNEPEGGRDHALDAVRYAFDGLRPTEHKPQTSSGNITNNLWGKRR